MSSSRLSLRLGQLPHDALAELAARLCSESPALQAIAEECMAAHKPLSHELVELALLSPDLVPSILGPLEAKDGATAAVCSQWLAGWKATNEPPWPRRRLKQVPLDLPEEIDASGVLEMTSTPDGRLVVCAREEVHILDRSMRVLQTVACKCNGVIASDDSIFHFSYQQTAQSTLLSRRSSHDGTIKAEYRFDGCGLSHSVLARGGLLFCVIWDAVNQDCERDEIIALDAQTLELRHRFGMGLLNGAHQLAVVGDELYVCDTWNDRLQVFSLTGEHRRSITGEWRMPQKLCGAKDRLYLGEERDDENEDIPLPGCRILVLSLQGDILQVVTHPTDPAAIFRSICCFDGKLLASYVRVCDEKLRRGDPDGGIVYGMLALRGL